MARKNASLMTKYVHGERVSYEALGGPRWCGYDGSMLASVLLGEKKVAKI